MRTVAGLQNTRDGTHATLTGFSSASDFANALNCFNVFDFSKEIQELSLKLCNNQHFSRMVKKLSSAERLTKARDLFKSVVDYLKPVQRN